MPNQNNLQDQQEIIKNIYHNNVKKIYRFFLYKFLNKELAEDATSKTFLVFVEDILKNKPIENYTNYLYGIAKIIFINELKQKYSNKKINLEDFEELLPEEIQTQMTNLGNKTLEEIIIPYINMLGEKQAGVIRLRIIEKMSLSEIAAKLNKNVNYVKTTQKRAIKNLKKLVACTPPSTY